MEEYLRQRAKARMLRVTMPNGDVLCFNKPIRTFIEALRRIGSEHFHRINLKVKGYPLLSKELFSAFKNKTEEVCDGWNVITAGDAGERFIKLRSIAEQLGINMKVEIGDNFITTKTPTKQTRKKPVSKLKVIFPDDSYLNGENPIDTFIETVKKIGPENIKRKEIEYQGKPVITYSKVHNSQVQVENYWVTVPGTTKEKSKMLHFLSLKMKQGLKVELIESNGASDS